MSSRDNTAANIPAITDKMLEELEGRGARKPENTAAKDKIINDLVAHVKKQHRVIRNLNEKVQPAEQWDIQQADIFADFIEKDAHYHNLDSSDKDSLISRLSDHIREKQQELARNVEHATRLKKAPIDSVPSDSSLRKPANSDVVELKSNSSSFTSEQRREIEESIKSELMLQIKDDLRKELLDEIGKQYEKSPINSQSNSRQPAPKEVSCALPETQEIQTKKRGDADRTVDRKVDKTVKVNVGFSQIRRELANKDLATAKKNVPVASDSSNAAISNPSKELAHKEIQASNNTLQGASNNSQKNSSQKSTPQKSTPQKIESKNRVSRKSRPAAATENKAPSVHVASTPVSSKLTENIIKDSTNSVQVSSSIDSVNVPSSVAAPATLLAPSEKNYKTEIVWPVKGAVVIEDDEEDEEDECDIDKTLDNEALYSLTEKLAASNKIGAVDHTAPTLIEVTRFHRGEIAALEHVAVGSSYSVNVGTKRVKIAANGKNNRCQIFYQQRYFSGGVGDSRDGCRDAENVKTLKAKNPKKLLRYTLPPDKIVVLKAGNDEYRLRVVPTTVPCKVADEKPVQGKRFRHFLQYSAGFHLLIILIGSLVYSLTHQKVEVKEEPRFAQVDLQELNPVKPTPVPKPPAPKKVAEVKIEKPEPKQKIKITKKPAAAKPKPKNAGGGSKDGGNIKKRDVKSSGLLAALGSKKGKTPGKKQTLAAVSSIDAVSSLDQDSAVLKVGGLAAKVKGSRIEVASGELINTQGSSKVLRSGGVEGEGQVGALESGVTGNRDVRGRVSATLTRTVKIKGGLSRDEVKSVIDAHMDEVVYCYEKTLLTNAGLAGKAVFEWKVLMSGRVGEVNIKSSSLRSNEIHSCIKSAVKSWQFPKPTGAAVFVSFPFIFDSVSF